MKKLIVVLTVMGLLAVPVLADYDAGTASITRQSKYWSGTGGEFTLYNSILDTSYYSPLAKNVPLTNLVVPVTAGTSSFQTFCVETDEYVMPPYTGNVVVSTTDVDVNGEVIGPGSHAVLGGRNTNAGDNLSSKTAFLYTMFATGKLSGYDYTPGVERRSSSAGLLQTAIWYFEDEVTLANPESNIFVKMANDAVATGGDWEDMGIGSVRILNLSKLTGAVAQDQLYYVPAPAAIGLGLLGLAIVGRYMRRYA